MDPTISLSGTGRRVHVGPNVITFRTTAMESNGRIGVIEYDVAPRFVAPPVLHWHTREAFTGYVIEGTLRFRFAGGVAEAGPGTTVHVPARCPFAWENPSDQPAKVLFMYTPGGFEAYFADLGELLARNPGQTVKDLMPQLLPLWEKYGIERE
jgi:mannose-6-phosphate isomerase-like protein (cupin superfamily)